MTQAEILQHLDENTHAFLKPVFVEFVNDAFKIKIKAREYKANPTDHKGLVLDDGAKWAVGISSLDLAQEICLALNVKYEKKLGRGSQVIACTDALRQAGYGKDTFNPDDLAGFHPDQSEEEKKRRGT